ITSNSLRCVAQALASHTVVVPSWRQRQGHSVGFDAAYRDALLTPLCGEAGAATVVRCCRSSGAVLDLPLDDIGIVMDVDTVEDLASAETLLRTRSEPVRGDIYGKH